MAAASISFEPSRALRATRTIHRGLVLGALLTGVAVAGSYSLYQTRSAAERSVIARGQCGSLVLHCATPSFATPRRLSRRYPPFFPLSSRQAVRAGSCPVKWGLWTFWWFPDRVGR
jgi:hypothetical protein